MESKEEELSLVDTESAVDVKVIMDELKLGRDESSTVLVGNERGRDRKICEFGEDSRMCSTRVYRYIHLNFAL
ncbi:hypothetical protein BDY24DRAFT_401784 [Mrakia frigida]|uniref:uncharacterized protein n=1 Tax=Mrakia frigida TaxID=29902 RepID=UPI003FCBFAA7